MRASLAVILVALGIAQGQNTPAVMRDLPEAGKGIQVELSPGEIQLFEASVPVGYYLHVDVLRQDADLTARLLGPGGRELMRVTKMQMGYPKLHFAVVADATGTYRLEVGWNTPGRNPVKYEIQMEDLRPATGKDRKQCAAEDAAREGDLLRDGPLESRRAALARYEEAQRLFHETGDQQNEGSTLVNLGAGYYLLGEPQKALTYFRQALPLKQAIEDVKGEANLWSNLGVVYTNLGEEQAALDAYSHAVPLTRKAKDSRLEDRALTNMGIALSGVGRPEKALEVYQEALTAARAAKDRSGESQALANMGQVYAGFGQPARAVEHLEEALAIAREIKDVRGEALTRNRLGSVLAEMSDLRRALQHHQDALALAHNIGDKRTEAETVLRVSEVRHRLGDDNGALEDATRALALLRSVEDRRNVAVALRDMGTAQLGLGRAEEARGLCLEALEIQQSIHARLDEADTLVELARAGRELGQLEESRERITASLEIFEDMRRRVSSPAVRASYRARLTRNYEFAIDLLMTMHQRNRSLSFDAEAFALNERARARVLIDLLLEPRPERGADNEDELSSRERALSAELQAKGERQVRILAGKHDAGDAKAIEDEITRLAREYDDLQARIRIRAGGSATSLEPRLLAITDVQRQALDQDTALFEFALGSRHSYLWAITSGTFTSSELPPRAEVESLARQAYEQLKRRGPGAEAAVEALSRVLLDPVRRIVTAHRRLLVVGDGALQYIPFAALRLGSGDLLGSRVEVVVLPSASTLAVLRQERERRREGAPTAVIFADPVFSADDPRVNRTASTSTGARPRALTRALEDLGVALERLPATRAEANTVAALVRKGGALKMLGFEASRPNVLSADLTRYRVLHFATHGLLNSRHPELSGLVLSLFDREGRPQDGFLAAHEIYGMKLEADLVVLSACETALGTEIRGEGLIGLARAFMYAGAPRVVASLWRVPDTATAELMKRFYRAMLVEGLRAAAALHRAQESLRQDPRWAHPYYWAGFTIHGDWT
jgi:CHAT domain-containing protein/Tfp pilus assembly protein PilF